MNKDTVRFFPVLFSYLRSINNKIFSTFEIIIALLVCFFCAWGISIQPSPANALSQLLNVILSMSAVILGIVVAGFAIYATVADKEFIVFLKKANVLKELMFPFWLGAVIWGFVILITLVSYTFSLGVEKVSAFFVALLTTFLFTLSLGFTISLVGSIFKASIYRAEYEYLKQQKNER